jgi:hypothetical protein
MLYPLEHLHTTGYIDLSKRRVDPEDVVKCEERYNKAKAVHSVLTHVAKTHNMPVEELCKKVGWPLYRKFGHAYDAFKIALKYVLLPTIAGITSDCFFSQERTPSCTVDVLNDCSTVFSSIIASFTARTARRPLIYSPTWTFQPRSR